MMPSSIAFLLGFMIGFVAWYVINNDKKRKRK